MKNLDGKRQTSTTHPLILIKERTFRAKHQLLEALKKANKRKTRAKGTTSPKCGNQYLLVSEKTQTLNTKISSSRCCLEEVRSERFT